MASGIRSEGSKDRNNSSFKEELFFSLTTKTCAVRNQYFYLMQTSITPTPEMLSSLKDIRISPPGINLTKLATEWFGYHCIGFDQHLANYSHQIGIWIDGNNIQDHVDPLCEYLYDAFEGRESESLIRRVVLHIIENRG